MARNKWTRLVGVVLIGLLVTPMMAGAQPPIQGPEGDQPAERPAEGMDVQANVATGFYYQGILTEAGAPVNATRQMEFQLFNAATGGNQVGSTITQSVAVSQGQFSVALTWGASEIDGRALWLRVRAMDSAGAWQDLGRKEIRAVPYAMSLYPGAVVKDRGSLTTTLTLDGGIGLFARGYWAGVEGQAYGLAYGITPYGGYFSSDYGVGVYGSSGSSYGVQGAGCSSPGCYGGYFAGYTGVGGSSTTSHGVRGQGCDNPGCYGGYFTGDSGIYAREQEDDTAADYAGYFVGDVKVTDELVVDGVASGFFPRPAFDSGWQTLLPGHSTVVNHNLGTDPDNYFVDIQCYQTIQYGQERHNVGIGGDHTDATHVSGAAYTHLNRVSVRLWRYTDDLYCNRVRVRIWVYK